MIKTHLGTFKKCQSMLKSWSMTTTHKGDSLGVSIVMVRGVGSDIRGCTRDTSYTNLERKDEYLKIILLKSINRDKHI